MSQDYISLGIKKFRIDGFQKDEHWYSPSTELTGYSLDDLKDKLRVHYAGIINRELVFFEPSLNCKK